MTKRELLVALREPDVGTTTKRELAGVVRELTPPRLQPVVPVAIERGAEVLEVPGDVGVRAA
jgi:hypothetical protein